MFLREVSIKDKTINNSYVYDIPMIQAFNSLSFNKPVTFLCGENGTGKSTLLEAIAIAYGFNPEGGSRNLMFSTCDTHSPLADNLRMVKGFEQAKDGFFLRAESFYNVATSIDENGWTIYTQDHKLSAQWENMVLITEKGYEILTK